MSYFISSPCIGVKDAACVSACPVDCIHTTPEEEMYFIDPEECISCGACLPTCPVEAIYLIGDEPESETPYVQKNADFFLRRE